MRLASTALAIWLSPWLAACGPAEEGEDLAPVVRVRSPAIAPLGAPVTFDASASSDDLGVTLLRAQFGDGGRETEVASLVFTHTYTQAGSYELQITALDAIGHGDALRRRITVVERYAPPYCDDTSVCEDGASCDQGVCFFEGELGRLAAP